MLAIKPERNLRQLIERRFPLRLQHARKMPLRIARIRPRQRIQRRRNHQLQISFRQHLVRVLEIQHLALFRDAQLPLERAQRLRKIARCVGPPPRPTVPPRP